MSSSQLSEAAISGLKLADDQLLLALASRSSLTRRQLEALLLEVSEEGRKRSFTEKASTMGVSKGSYARTLYQSLKNLTESMFTVILMSYLGLLGEEGYKWFIDVGEALRDGRVEEALEILDDVQRKLKRTLRIER